MFFSNSKLGFIIKGVFNVSLQPATANESGRRLIIFRDSYTSSLAPLLVDSYSEVLLLDTRYIYPHMLGSFVTPEEFTDADVLFMYSAMILNDSNTLR
jgi:hypothetical protein